jgi:transcription elongation factor S-II
VCGTHLVRQETKAGLAVGKLRSHASKEVADLAKEIVKKWKSAVEKEKLANGAAPKPQQNGKPGVWLFSDTRSMH